eukprot:217099-Chlamydomonas_euryale.AAC.1
MPNGQAKCANNNAPCNRLEARWTEFHVFSTSFAALPHPSPLPPQVARITPLLPPCPILPCSLLELHGSHLFSRPALSSPTLSS